MLNILEESTDAKSPDPCSQAGRNVRMKSRSARAGNKFVKNSLQTSRTTTAMRGKTEFIDDFETKKILSISREVPLALLK